MGRTAQVENHMADAGGSGRPPVGRHGKDEADAFAVRLVPISAAQIQALESLARAFAGLTTDFWRDYGVDHDDRIAGGLYRLCSTLEMVVAQWREESEDVGAVENRRRALEAIESGDYSGVEARTLAARALAGT
jgi:hypothetical protein